MTDSYYLWRYDIENRKTSPTLSDVLTGSIYIATAVISGVTTNSSPHTSQWDAYLDLRNRVLDVSETDGARLHPIVTTTQRDLLTGIMKGTTVYNDTIGGLEEYDGTSWIPISGGNEINITASTTQTQTGATLLSSVVNLVETVANDGDAVKLESVSNGVEQTIINDGVKTLQIFPFLGDDLGNGTNVSMELEIHEEITFWGKTSSTWHVLHNSESFHGSMYDQDNSTAFVIHAVNEVHAYHSSGMISGDLGEWTFNAGSAGASVTISSIADNSGGTILVTTGSVHGITVGDIICQTVTTDTAYKGFFTVLTVPTTTTYTVTATFGVTRTGFVDRPAYLTPNDISVGFYNLEWTSTMSIVGSGVTLAFDLHDGTSTIAGSKDGHKFASTATIKSLSGLGEKIISSSDRVFFTITNETDATNITLEHFKMRLEHI